MGTRILEWVGGLSSWVLVLASTGLAFAETAMFLDLVVPGEVGMVIVGAAAARSEYPLLPVVVAGMPYPSRPVLVGDSGSERPGITHQNGRFQRPALGRLPWLAFFLARSLRLLVFFDIGKEGRRGR